MHGNVHNSFVCNRKTRKWPVFNNRECLTLYIWYTYTVEYATTI